MALGLVAVLGAAALVDELHPDRVVLLALDVVPLAAALLARLRTVVIVSVAATVLAVTLPDSLYEGGQLRYIRLVSIVGLCALAVVSAVWRDHALVTRTESEAARLAAENARRVALQMNDTIVQEVFSATSWLAMERRPEAEAALARALDAARALVGELLGQEPIRPGDLVRTQAHGKPSRE